MQGLLRRVLALWVRATLRPEDALARLAARTVPICYVLERRSPSDLAVLQNACLRERLPRPGRRLLPQQLRNLRSWFALTKSVGLWRTRVDRRPPEQLLALIDALRRDPTLDVSLVPAAVYWGRAPSKERSLIRLLLSEDWVIGSRVRRFFTVLFNGRSTTVQLGRTDIAARAAGSRRRHRADRSARRAPAAQSVCPAAYRAPRAGPVAPAHHRGRGAAHPGGASGGGAGGARSGPAQAPRDVARGAPLCK